MNTLNIRIVKEARTLFVLWCAVFFACALPLFLPVKLLRSELLPDFMAAIVLFLGIPLLVSFPFGNEFQHRTLSLLLSAPVDRMRIWSAKWIVSIIAVALTIIPLALSNSRLLTLSQDNRLFSAVWLILIVSSGAFWTLVARSTLGGVVLNIAIPVVLLVPASYLFANRPPAALFAASLAYAAIMLWLGRRKLARFESAEGFVGPDLLTAGPAVMPARVAALLRCRPDQYVRNLIRKEVRLLMPLWAITALFVFGAIVTTFWYRFNPAAAASRGYPTLFVVLLSVFPVISIILAGAVSLGEEGSTGVQSWHTTLPRPAGFQWLIKLLVTLSAGFFCAYFLPFVLTVFGRFVLGGMDVGRSIEETLTIWPLLLIMFVFSFWSATLVRGTVRAVSMLTIAGGALYIVAASAMTGGSWGRPIARSLGHLVLFVVTRFQLNPFAFEFLMRDPYRRPDIYLALWVIPPLCVALFQSYRFFQQQPASGFWRITRRLLPISFATLLTFFCYGFSDATMQPAYDLVHEVGRSVVAFHPDLTKSDASNPINVTVEDLSASSAISEGARQWLNGAAMTVAARDEGTFWDGHVARKAFPFYIVSIHLARGSTCSLTVAHSVISHKYDMVFAGPCK